jgi:hypothetical protein
MQLMNRLEQWAQIQKVRPALELPDVTGGRDAEVMLKHLVASSFQFKDASLLAGRRIPSKRQHRRREIDLIVCTHRKIHLIEIKNWSGVLDVRNGVWRQTRRNGEVVEHPDLLRENLLRRDAVVEYLHDRGLHLVDSFVRNHIVPEVIFMNPRLAITPDIEALPEVISRRELDGYLGRQEQKGLTERVFASLIDLCMDREARAGGSSSRAVASGIPDDQYRQIVGFLSETSTWDQVQLYGSRMVTGDVVTSRLGGKTYRKPELIELSGGLPITVEWTRSRFWGLLKAIGGFGPLGTITLGNDRRAISLGDTLNFHPVGETDSASFRLTELERIVLG